MPCSFAWRTLMFLSTNPSARSARMATSFFVPTPFGPPSPFDASPASTITSSALTPDPSSWRLHRMQGPSSGMRSEEHTSELQSRLHLVCRLLLEKKKKEQYN